MLIPPPRLDPYTLNLPSGPVDSSEAATAASPNPGTIATRLLILSDTHNTALFAPNKLQRAFRAPLPRADIVLHAGDLTNSGLVPEYHTTLNVLASVEAELKLVIAGNHDLTLDLDYLRAKQLGAPRFKKEFAAGGAPGTALDQVLDRVRTSLSSADRERVEMVVAQERTARQIWTSDDAKRAGIVFLDEGVHQFELKNGAKFTIYASPYSPEYNDCAFMYPRKHDRYTAASSPRKHLPGSFTAPNPIPSHPAIDIVMTHGPPAGILDRANAHNHVGCTHLQRALARVRPRLHVFGHIHEDWGAMRVDWSQGKARSIDSRGRVHAGKGKSVTYEEDGDHDDEEADDDDSEQGDTNEAGHKEDDDEKEHWWKVAERGYVALDFTGDQRLGPIRKGRPKPEAEEEDNTLEPPGDGVYRFPPLRWGQETLALNATIKDSGFRAMNAPFVVDLMLPSREDAGV